ncbi:MAG: shikimate dehydrogenase [Clostridia bacterium]|nr:shikimate dehydrogenase [Clostridia bacterium]
MKKFAVIGHPIGHTMSPFIHKRLFSLSGIEAEYVALDIPTVYDSESELCKLDGFNVTIPHKINIIDILDELDDKAKAFGSVNTVYNENGKLKGFTTDGVGCLKALRNHGSGFDGKLLILGNGGAARAIASEAVLTNSGADITVCVRTGSEGKGEELKSHLLRLSPNAKITVTDYVTETVNNTHYDLLINTTSVGMYPNAGISPVPKSVVERCDAVFDCVYNPGETELLKIAADLGRTVIPGIEMLVFQAVAAHEYWYNAKFDREDIMKLCTDSASETERLFRKS